VPDERTLGRLREGVRVDGERLAADRIRVLEADRNAWLEITLHEGRKHEVRRLLESVGHPVSKLRRVAIGPVTTRGLEPGQFRHLTPAEVAALQRPNVRAAVPERARHRRVRPRPSPRDRRAHGERSARPHPRPQGRPRPR
jgi:16S rRNA U516 pseudouridylate synthase RsuA-like enzyme